MHARPADIKQIHLELTERCNAACPLCIRTNPDGLRPRSYIGTQELFLDDISDFFTPVIRDQLLEVHMCGSYGDPVMARDCLKIATYFSTDACEVSLSTNGSIRGTSWWSKLGKVFARNGKSRVDFHIDGLADTNHYYRRNTSFKRIIDNAKSYIDAGGRANWEFIPFKHNEHQIEEARELSILLGFSRFTVKKSNWLFDKGRTRIPFSTRTGERRYLEAPSSKHLPERKKNRSHVILAGSVNKHIQCLAQRCSELYVSCEGVVYPCCWTARFARNIYLGRETSDGFSTLFRQYDGREVFNIREHRLEEMLQSDFFSALANRWKKDEPAICYKKCGKKDQPEKVKLENKSR